MINKQLEIKICGMREPDNIREVIELSPDYLGFIFYPKSPRFIRAYPEVNFPSTIKKVGVFVNASENEINRQKERFGLDVIQLHGDESPEFCYLLKQSGVELTKAFRIDDDFDFTSTYRYEDFVDYFLFDTGSKKYGGSGKKFNWQLLKNYNNARPVFLSGGIGPGDASEILELKGLNMMAIDINSCFETEPGRKDIEKLMKFISELKDARQ